MSGLSRRGLLAAAAGGVAVLAAPPAAYAGSSGPQLSLDGGQQRLTSTVRSPREWADHLAGQDLVWRRLPATFAESAFLGNGAIGAAVYQHPSRQAVRIDIGDNRVRDHQQVGGAMFGQARLRVGFFSLETVGEVTAVDLRLSLWDAELSGTVTTSVGVVVLRCLVHATRDLVVAEARPDAGEADATWSFTAYPAQSTRLSFTAPPRGLAANPAPDLTNAAHGGSCVQSLAAGGAHATVWRTVRQHGGTRLVASVAASYPSGTALPAAERVVRDAMTEPIDRLAGAHRAWWHRFYPTSFVAVPDRRLAGFYWTQLYKVASATRQDRPVVSTTGPWLQPTPRPGIWWNLTVQLAYWLINATGHPELDSLTRSLDEHRDALERNAPAGYRDDSSAIARSSQEDLRSASVTAPGAAAEAPEVGNLTCALHNAWLSYRHSMDDTVLRGVLFPLLRRAVNYYLHLLTEGADGRLHLPDTYSPGCAATPDCNYDLALLTWGCRTLLDAAERLGLDDPLRPRWRDVLDRLVDPPQGTAGLRVGARRDFTPAYRQPSHLVWFHPLRLLDVTQPVHRDLLARSLRGWAAASGTRHGAGLPAAASMSALLGEGDRALNYLTLLCDRHLTANTMYLDEGPELGVPLAGAQSLIDMLVQSWGGVLRIFPAVPASWYDVTVHDLRTEGGFRVSAVRRGGLTQFVRVRSTAGEPCVVAPGMPGPYRVRRLAGDPAPSRELGGGLVELGLSAGDDVVLFTEGTEPDLTIAPVHTDDGAAWGLPTGP
ncbi:MAG: Tat pathway signal sequence domain protein [Actinocatenispora sp.]